MLLTCIESLHCITEALRDNYAEDVREALRVLNQFPEAFEDIDKKLSDPVLKDICRHLPELHFGLTKALIETPAKTIKDAYFKRTGKILTESFCTAAYHTIRAFDIEQGKIPVQKHCSENSCKDTACRENSLRVTACRENSSRNTICGKNTCRDAACSGGN